MALNLGFKTQSCFLRNTKWREKVKYPGDKYLFKVINKGINLMSKYWDEFVQSKESVPAQLVLAI